jgi:PhnB protein
MFEVRIEKKQAFEVLGRKAWMKIYGPEDFALLLKEATENGLIETLKSFSPKGKGAETNTDFLSIAITPPGGTLNIYIAAEVPAGTRDGELESFTVPSSTWAIMTAIGASAEDIASMENYAYGEWLLESGCVLSDAPQLNAFLSAGGQDYAELWLPLMERKKEKLIKVRPYLTFNGTCREAIELYKRAFLTDTIQLIRYSDRQQYIGIKLPNSHEDLIMQATLRFGDDFVRMSDCWPGHHLNEAITERSSIAIEARIGEVKHAFSVLAKEGRVAVPLAETFYSPCAGVVFDKFGVMWNFAATK